MTMGKAEAAKLLEEALHRVRDEPLNASGSGWQAGGAFWRLVKVLTEHVEPQLEECEGHHAARVREAQGPALERLAARCSAPNMADQDCIIRLPEVQHLTGYSRSGLYAAMKRGDFPEGFKLGPRATGWREADVRAWLQSRPTVYGTKDGRASAQEVEA